jgi:hypothetical protein
MCVCKKKTKLVGSCASFFCSSFSALAFGGLQKFEWNILNNPPSFPIPKMCLRSENSCDSKGVRASANTNGLQGVSPLERVKLEHEKGFVD